uniref:Uncharacterized protein n=1 Tax=Anguilla anguilla TaxID=7936 RepID=A0A0E9PYE6_ANGAN
MCSVKSMVGHQQTFWWGQGKESNSIQTNSPHPHFPLFLFFFFLN